MTAEQRNSVVKQQKQEQLPQDDHVDHSNYDTRLLSFDPETFDIYLRMKKSSDHDFCFQVNSKTTFRDLFKIFEVVPIVFSPSIFYTQAPSTFSVSEHPGYISRTGAIVFDTQAHDTKYLKPVDLDSKIKDHVLPGQLVVPKFEERTFLKLSIFTFFLVWLYTDLPDFISPTPGISLTNHATIFITYVLREYLDMPQQAAKFYDDIFEPVGIPGQCIYFVFHIMKIAMFYFILWAGMFNPYKFTFVQQKLGSLSKENLLEIGWTSAMKASKTQYQDEYRKQLIAQYGSIMNLFRSGKLGYIKDCLFELKNGEGYATNHPQTDEIDVPLPFTRELLMKERAYMNTRLRSLNFETAFEELKNYRKYGPKFPCPELKEIVDKKFEKWNVEIEENAAKANPLFASLNKKQE